MTVDSYIMESTEETKRLMLQVDSDELIDQYVSPIINQDRSSSQSLNNRLLETGPGPGHLTESIGAKHPELQITAIDINSERLRQAAENTAELNNVELKIGDITDLPLPSDSYRYVFCRFVLEHIKKQQETAIGELYRVLEPGGVMILQSVDQGLGIHFPETPYLAEIKEKLHQVLLAHNYDPNTGRYLKFLSQNAGFVLEEKPSVEIYKLYSNPVSVKELEAYELKLQIGFPMFALAFDSHEEATEAQQYMLNYVKRPDTLSYSILMTVVARKPE
jgi:ubiquinone/menaquinone biosynthesis C-methylase UbiE